MPAVLMVLILLGGAAQAADLREVSMDKQDGVYSLRSVVWFGVRREPLFAVFLNYDLAEKFSSFVAESRNLEPNANGQRRFYIRNEGCVWFFCHSFERTGVIEHTPYRTIFSTADAAVSDFESSVESWTFSSEGDGTLVVYTFDFVPKFWIPPLIGPYVLQRKLEQDSIRALNRIEAIARGEF